jgi:hypothetical protein
MTPQEKAKCGLWLLKEAYLEYVATRPDGVRGEEVREALELPVDADSEGEHKGWLLWGLGNLLVQEGKLVKRRVGRGHKNFLAPSAEANP